jgi:tetratricopeptide (TPR) repeat protein
MPNRSTDELFQLIKSLDKSEKRLFKLHVKRISGTDDLKILALFDALDNMTEYDEDKLLRKHKSIQKQQLSNMKAYLYKQLLASLTHSSPDIETVLSEYIMYARLLYNKGLYMQSLKILDKVKAAAKTHNQSTYRLQALIFEKKIEAMHITRSMEGKAEELSKESDEVSQRVSRLNKLASFALQLYSWYIQHGHARDKKDEKALHDFFFSYLPTCQVCDMDFYEKLYYYQAYTWYTFILQDLLGFYRYSQKWVDLFEENRSMKDTESIQYVKGLHNLSTAHFVLSNYKKFDEVLHLFESFWVSKAGQKDANTQIQTFIYMQIALLNKHFMHGTFTKGLSLVPYIEEKIEEYKLHIDTHRILIFYYKIACLYFGSGDNEKAIDYLNLIINLRPDLRTDLHCYSRLLHLIAHFELGNYDLVEYLIKSVYRFMAKMNNLNIVEEEIFRFLRKSFNSTPAKIVAEFEPLKNRLESLKGNPLATRSFMYLDIIGWLESKIENVPVQDIIHTKYLKAKKSRQAADALN